MIPDGAAYRVQPMRPRPRPKPVVRRAPRPGPSSWELVVVCLLLMNLSLTGSMIGAVLGSVR